MRPLPTYGAGLSPEERATALPETPHTPRPTSTKRLRVKAADPRTWWSSLRAVSVKRAAERPARREAVAHVVARDQRCQFPLLAEACAHELSEEDRRQLASAGPCWGPLTAHEPAGSVNVGRTDPEASICACWAHNAFAETHTGVCLRIGFVVRGAGFPLRHVRETGPFSTLEARR